MQAQNKAKAKNKTVGAMEKGMALVFECEGCRAYSVQKRSYSPIADTGHVGLFTGTAWVCLIAQLGQSTKSAYT